MADIEELFRIATEAEGGAPNPGVDQGGLPGFPQQQGPILQSQFNEGGSASQPQFEQGGFVQAPPPGVGPGGPAGPVPTPAGAGVNAGGPPPPIPVQQMQADIQRVIKQKPEEILKIKQAVQQGLQSGELTMEELNLAGQLAMAAAQNPALWPKLRAFAIQQGLADENIISQEYDQGLVYSVLLAVQGGAQDGAPQAAGQPPQLGQPQAAGQPPVAGLRTGGAVPDSRNKDGSVSAIVHDGEFVIPAHVVKAKGTDFFDKMIEPKDASKTA